MMNVNEMNAAELAEAYVTAYVANLPHNELENEIVRRGVDCDDLAGIMSGYCLSSAEAIERATEEELDERIADAERAITNAIREANVPKADLDMIKAWYESDSRIRGLVNGVGISTFDDYPDLIDPGEVEVRISVFDDTDLFFADDDPPDGWEIVSRTDPVHNKGTDFSPTDPNTYDWNVVIRRA